MILDALVLENGKRWGEVATPEQRQDAEHILNTKTEPNAFLTRARGWSKTTDLAAMTGTAMLEQLPPGAAISPA